MYGKNKKLGVFLGAIYAFALVTALILLSKQPPTDIGLVPPFPMAFTLCYRAPSSEFFWLFMIASSVDTITLSLFCVKVYIAWKDSMTTPILSALFTQGAIYYAVIICTFAISIPATMHKEIYIPLMDTNMVILISCIAGSRLILSLRGLYYSQMTMGPTTLGTVVRVDFGHTALGAVSCTSSGGTATSLGTARLADYDQRDGRRGERLGDPDIGLENGAQAGRNSTGFGTPTAESGVAV